MTTSAPYLTALLVLVALPACAGSDNQAETANTSPPVETQAAEEETPDAKSGCVEVFVRQRDCTDDFIPALVDARIRLDVPAGIAERASAEGSGAIITEAMAEWANDSQDAAIDGTCDGIVASVPAEALKPMLTASKSCLEESECSAFSTCIIPVIEGQLK
jgi:hypothetical protein